MVPRLKGPLLLRVFGYVEPGTAAAATDRMGEPFCSNTGVGAPLGPSRSHCFRTGGGWSFLIFGFFGGNSHPSIRKSENIQAQDSLCALKSGCSRRRRSRRTRYVFGGPRRITSNAYQAAMSSLASPAPSAFAFRRSPVRIR